MRYYAMACDYDGTLAINGTVPPATLAACERLRASGRRMVLVTGRELDDLRRVFSRLDLFDAVVAENGALLFRPQERDVRQLAEPPPDAFMRALRRRDVSPLSTGRVIVATKRPNESVVLAAIRDLGLEMQVIFNRSSVMVLPSGVNKATGLAAALEGLGLSPHNVVAIGDAENDHALLKSVECAAAVADALPSLRRSADLITAGRNTAGVAEMIDRLIATDLVELEPRLSRHHVLLGTREDGTDVRISPYGEGILLAGTSGSGKSTIAMGFLERLAEANYQYSIIDPEGDYPEVPHAVVLGSTKGAPAPDEVQRAIDRPGQGTVVNLVGVPLEHRPPLFEQLRTVIHGLRGRTGRPHWLVIDEAHHLLPASWAPTVERDLRSALLITVHPEHVSRVALESVDVVLAVGEAPLEALRQFAEARGIQAPLLEGARLQKGEAILWRPATEEVIRVRCSPPRQERQRHLRKYAEGDLGPEKSFIFRGPEGKLRLKAQNLMLFLQLADGVDDDTWEHHRRRGDYSQWLRTSIKDQTLADEVAAIEQLADLTPRQSREAVRLRIEAKYTAAA